MALESGCRKLATNPARVERVRLLLAELETAANAYRHKLERKWQDSQPEEITSREEAYFELRALAGVQRELTNVLRTTQLEHPNG
jgi:hypothetical protein